MCLIPLVTEVHHNHTPGHINYIKFVISKMFVPFQTAFQPVLTGTMLFNNDLKSNVAPKSHDCVVKCWIFVMIRTIYTTFIIVGLFQLAFLTGKLFKISRNPKFSEYIADVESIKVGKAGTSLHFSVTSCRHICTFQTQTAVPQSQHQFTKNSPVMD